MEKKYCIVCGAENCSRSKFYCSLKCKNKDYYKKNKEELDKKHEIWNQQNREKVLKYKRDWAKKQRESLNEGEF